MYKILVIAATVFMVSCIQEDHFGSSSENKLLSFSLENQVGNTQIDQESDTVNVVVSSDADVSSLAPLEITVSTFAQISPEVGEKQDFSEPVIYRVTAENGSVAEYIVVVFQEGSEPQLENSSFDDWYTTPSGYQEPGIDANTIWASGNAGTVTLGDPNVTPLTINGDNIAAQLVTLDLGGLAGLVGQRMGAGSMFTGEFELDLANPLNSTKFGIAFTARPKSFSVKYAYSPGTPYLNRNGQVLNQTDSCDIYMFLENRDGEVIKRMATGWFRSGEESIDQFTTITVDLIYGELGSDVPDYQKPANGLYGVESDRVTHLTVVFASSFNGALLEGGTNSTLVVDDFQLNY
jgi:hypothetical protein